jgi:hypothetical protein
MPLSRSVAYRSGRELDERLRADEPLWGVELRPPLLTAGAGRELESWIDLYHVVRRLAGEDTLLFLTDNAVGAREEESLRHLQANLGGDADLSRVVPFLTAKHPLEYCLRFPERAAAAGHRALVVLGGDRHDGVPRCVPHGADLRRLLRQRFPSLLLGGWVNPYRDPRWQVDLLRREEPPADFLLTQVVSHHDLGPVERLLAAAASTGLSTPVLFGVFFYRSARPETLDRLRRLLPVPVGGLEREFGVEGLDAAAVCERTVAALTRLGVQRFYLCNLPVASAPGLLARLRATGRFGVRRPGL